MLEHVLEPALGCGEGSEGAMLSPILQDMPLGRAAGGFEHVNDAFDVAIWVHLAVHGVFSKR